MNVARLHCRKSVCWPKKFNLVLQTVSPREGAGSRDETNGKLLSLQCLFLDGKVWPIYMYSICVHIYM